MCYNNNVRKARRKVKEEHKMKKAKVITAIKYKAGDFGPYVKEFETQGEALSWLAVNQVQILSIDFVG